VAAAAVRARAAAVAVAAIKPFNFLRKKIENGWELVHKPSSTHFLCLKYYVGTVFRQWEKRSGVPLNLLITHSLEL
jgi:hypothetical protein